MVNIIISKYEDLTKGSRVQLVKTNDHYTDLEKNEYIGIVDNIILVTLTGEKQFTQIWVNWSNGGYFAIVPETGDKFLKLEHETK